jgi:hypothetical protein
MAVVLAARLAFKGLQLAANSPAARSTMARMAKKEAIRQVTNPVELAKNVGILAIKPAKVAAIAYGVKEGVKENDRLKAKQGAESAKPGRTAVNDAVRTAAKLGSYAYTVHPANWTKNAFLGAAYVFGIPNTGAMGRTTARLKHAIEERKAKPTIGPAQTVPEAPARSGYATKDGRAVEATEAQKRAWANRRKS